MRKYLLLMFIPAIIVSCKKNPGNPVPAVTVETYFPAKAGNYWVYEEFDEDTTTGIFANTGQISDSIYYSNDTSLNGKTYHVFYDFIPGNSLLANMYSLIWRDSSGYMLDQNDVIEFSTQSFNDTLQSDSTYNATFKYIMVKNVNISVPAGSFNTLEFKGIITASALFTPDPKYYYSFNYASNVGLVMYHFLPLTVLGGAFERRLIRYHLN